MTTYNTKNPLGSAAVKDLFDNAENLDVAVNDPNNDEWVDRLGKRRKTLSGQERQFNSFMVSSEERFQDFLATSGYQFLGEYTAGLQIASFNQVFSRDGEFWRAAPATALPYTTSGDWNAEGDAFVAVGDAVLRQDLAKPSGADMLGFDFAPDTGRATGLATAIRELRETSVLSGTPAIQEFRYNQAFLRDESDWAIIANGELANRYHHSPKVVRDAQGRFHTCYSRGLFHGYGSLVPPNAVDPQGEIIYRYSDDEGKTWSPEQIVCVALPPDPINVFRTVFDCHIGVCPSGRLVMVVSDIPPPSEQWGVPTGSTKYRRFINDNRGQLKGDGTHAWEDRDVFFESYNDYARVYCARIKQIPKEGGGFRMAFCDYRKVDDSGNLAIYMWYSDDEFETAPQQGAHIMYLDGTYNETDFCFFDSKLGFAISRGNGTMHITRDAGATWTKIGSASNYTRVLWEQLVGPTLDVVWNRGKPYLLLGYSHRGAGPDGARWLAGSLEDIFAFESAVLAGEQFTPWGVNNFSGPTTSGASGYNSAVHYEDGGLVYVDCTETVISSTTNYRVSDIRITRANSSSWFPMRGGVMIGSNVSRITQYNNNEIPYLPVLAGLGAAGTPTYSSRAGYNIRIGQLAFVSAKLESSSFGGASGQLVLRGLPFAPLGVGIDTANNFDVVVLTALSGSVQAGDQIFGLFLQGSNQIALYRKPAGSAAQALTFADVGSSLSLRVSGFYFCANEGLT